MYFLLIKEFALVIYEFLYVCVFLLFPTMLHGE